jgi:hypothetical protein
VARRLFLHVGTMKSGTSYLRSLWWQNHTALAERGLLLPGRNKGDHFHAACVVVGRRDVLERQDAAQARSWEAAVEQVAATDGDALIGQDHFSRATPRQAAAALAQLREAAGEVHVLVTARDLGRQLGSAWQQDVKEGSSETLHAYWERARAEGPDGDFWGYHDVPAVLGRWSQDVPDDRVHLVVLPRPGSAPREWLWEQVCGITGVDPTGLVAEPERSNESLGAVAAELLRRVNAALPDDARTLDTVRFLKGHFTRQVLAGSGDDSRLTTTPEMHAWAREHALTMVEDLRERPWHVVGDLADLVPDPDPAPGTVPDPTAGDPITAVAVDALVGQLLRGREQRERIRSLREEVRRLRG